MRKTVKGKDPRNIVLPPYNTPEFIGEKDDLTYAAKLDDIWDGESVDEEKENEFKKFF